MFIQYTLPEFASIQARTTTCMESRLDMKDNKNTLRSYLSISSFVGIEANSGGVGSINALEVDMKLTLPVILPAG